MSQAIPSGSIVYVRYQDHVLFKNTSEPVSEVADRETVGWLTHENPEHICIEHDRTIEQLQFARGTGSGVVLLKSCIREIRVLPLQNGSNWPLIAPNDIARKAESALPTAKRKTQPQ